MSIFHILSQFGLAENTLGLSAADFIEIVFCALLILLVLGWKSWGQGFAATLVDHPRRCVILLVLLPVVLRLALYPYHPAPLPNVHDDFGHLLVADTLLHFRLANPAHPLHQFFETIYVLQEPTYSSIYPLGQGLTLAAGRVLFGHPWGGVILADALFCGLCYWMLRGWTTPEWALAGGLLTVIQFTALSHWMNSYWGGAVSACAGCLAFGALPRLRALGRKRDAAFLGLGMAMQALTRPFETTCLALCVALYLLPALRTRTGFQRLLKAAPVFLLTSLPAIGLILLQNKAVTGEWTKLPYMLSQYQYGVPDSLAFRPMPLPHRQLTPEQQACYDAHAQVHASDSPTARGLLNTIEYRVRFYRFFFAPPILLILPFAWLAFRERRFLWMILFPVIFAFGSTLYPFFFVHYIAAVTCIFVLWSVTALERLSKLWARGKPLGQTAAALILFLCCANFLFWYGLHVFDHEPFSAALRRYENADAINHREGELHAAIDQKLAKMPGKLLIFVHYSPGHSFHLEWVYNNADIDSARVVWARDLGSTENKKLLDYYPNRPAWFFDADNGEKLVPYDISLTTPTR